MSDRVPDPSHNTLCRWSVWLDNKCLTCESIKQAEEAVYRDNYVFTGEAWGHLVAKQLERERQARSEGVQDALTVVASFLHDDPCDCDQCRIILRVTSRIREVGSE